LAPADRSGWQARSLPRRRTRSTTWEAGIIQPLSLYRHGTLGFHDHICTHPRRASPRTTGQRSKFDRGEFSSGSVRGSVSSYPQTGNQKKSLRNEVLRSAETFDSTWGRQRYSMNLRKSSSRPLSPSGGRPHCRSKGRAAEGQLKGPMERKQPAPPWVVSFRNGFCGWAGAFNPHWRAYVIRSAQG